LTNLALESASGGSMILNEQQLLPGLGVTDDAFQKWLNEFETDWVPAGCRLRKPGLLRYNCHGLTFANRRSWISELSEIPKILHDDGYTQVRDEDVLPGDIVVYYSGRGRAEHSGIVVGRDGAQGVRIPIVLSKWAWACEVIHGVGQCPYASPDTRYYRLGIDKTNAEPTPPPMVVELRRMRDHHE